MLRPHHIPFNRAYVTGAEFAYMQEAIADAHLAGNGRFSRRCCEWLERRTGARLALLTHSCTGALEMAMTLIDIQPGDEVILPSFTFVSSANAIVARGGVPVFVDIDQDTLCLDVELIEPAITPRTKAIMPVHYAAVGCQMDRIMQLAADRLFVVEDAAQAICASIDDKALGGIGDVGALSFHETKNVSCGEGGAILINDDRLADRAEIIHEKGTDRRRFFRGEVDKYSWVDVGSSYLLSDLAAAYLWAQLERADEINSIRFAIWRRYHEAFADDEASSRLRRPFVPLEARHNAHMYYVLLPDLRARSNLIQTLADADINAVFHYVPLHNSRAGREFGRTAGTMAVTISASERLVRLPLWAGMREDEIDRVIDAVHNALRTAPRGRGISTSRSGLR